MAILFVLQVFLKVSYCKKEKLVSHSPGYFPTLMQFIFRIPLHLK